MKNKYIVFISISIIFLLVLTPLYLQTAFSQGLQPLTLPDPASYIGTQGIDAGEYVMDNRVYTLLLYEREQKWVTGMAEWLDACTAVGYASEETYIDNKLCYVISLGDKQVVFVPQYSSNYLLLMLENSIELLTPSPTPTTTPYQPTLTPVPSGGHIKTVYEEVEYPCTVCYTTGKCKLCHGSGTYTRYGVSVSCPRECSFCGGVGYYTQIVAKTVWVEDD